MTLRGKAAFNTFCSASNAQIGTRVAKNESSAAVFLVLQQVPGCFTAVSGSLEASLNSLNASEIN